MILSKFSILYRNHQHYEIANLTIDIIKFFNFNSYHILIKGICGIISTHGPWNLKNEITSECFCEQIPSRSKILNWN